MAEQKTFAIHLDLPKEQLYNEIFVDSNSEASVLVNNTLQVYAQSRRIQQHIIGNWPTDANREYYVLTIPAGGTVAILNFNSDFLVTGASRRLKIYMYYQTSGAAAINLHLKCGRHEAVTTGIQSAGADVWTNVEVECEPNQSPILKDGRQILLYLSSDDTANTITIKSISMFEPGAQHSIHSWIDTTGGTNKLGYIDRPYSAATSRIFLDNTEACHKERVTRANIFNQSFEALRIASDLNYGVNNDRLGRYVIRKGEGVTQIDGDLKIRQNATVVGAWEHFRLELREDTDGDNIFETNISTQTVSYQHVVGNLQDWFTVSFAGLPSAYKEYELKVDAKVTDVLIGSHGIRNLFLVETLDGATEYSVLPSKKKVQIDDDILSDNWFRCRNTLHQIYNRNRQILLNDYRHDAMLVTDRGASMNSGERITIHTSGVLYPSYGTKYIICDAVFSKPVLDNSLAVPYDTYAPPPTFQEPTDWTTTGEDLTFENAAGDVNARGLLVKNDTVNNILYVKDIQVSPLDNSTITGAVSGATAAVNGVATTPNLDVKTYFCICYGLPQASDYKPPGTATILKSIEYSLKYYPRGRLFNLRFVLPIPREYWNNRTAYGPSPDESPVIFSLTSEPSRISSTEDNCIDFLNLYRVKVFEYIPPALEDY